MEARLALRDVLLALPPRRRAVLVLRFLDDLPESQVAEILGCSVGTVRSQSHRAVAQLRLALPSLALTSAEVHQSAIPMNSSPMPCTTSRRKRPRCHRPPMPSGGRGSAVVGSACWPRQRPPGRSSGPWWWRSPWPTWALATVAVPRHQHRRLPCFCGHRSCSRRWRRQAGRPARFTLRRCWPLTGPRVSGWVASG